MAIIKETEKYKGFSIMYYINGGRIDCERTGYFYIKLDNERFSMLCLNSQKACKNVIDTYLNNKILTPKEQTICQHH